jgi:hypothetical protein
LGSRWKLLAELLFQWLADLRVQPKVESQRRSREPEAAQSNPAPDSAAQNLLEVAQKNLSAPLASAASWT